MKKNLILLIIIISMFITYFFFRKIKQTHTSVTLPDNLVVQNANLPGSNLSIEDIQNAVKKTEETIEKSLDNVEIRYDAHIAEFNNLVLSLFIHELKLSKEAFEDYLKMREGLANDKLVVFESFHKKMEEKYGENYSYNPSDEEIQFEKDIQTRYDNLLLSKIGKENFIKYLELRDNFNNVLIEKQDLDTGVILMEF